jgi:hypothetical protein
LEELVIPLKIGGSQASIQQFHNDFDPQDRPFRQCVILMDLISDNLYGFVDWNIGKKEMTSKLTRVLEIEGLQTSTTVHV